MACVALLCHASTMHVVILRLLKSGATRLKPKLHFRRRVVCAKCGDRGNKIDVRPNWKEAPGSLDDWHSNPAMPTGEE